MFFSCSQSLPSDLSQKIKSCFVGQKKDRTLTVLLLLKEVVDVRWLVCGCQPVILLYHLACYLIPTKRLSAAPRSHHAGTPPTPPLGSSCVNWARCSETSCSWDYIRSLLFTQPASNWLGDKVGGNGMMYKYTKQTNRKQFLNTPGRKRESN